MTNRNVRRVQRRIFEALGRRGVEQGFVDAMPKGLRPRRIGRRVYFLPLFGWRMASFLRGYREANPITVVLD